MKNEPYMSIEEAREKMKRRKENLATKGDPETNAKIDILCNIAMEMSTLMCERLKEEFKRENINYAHVEGIIGSLVTATIMERALSDKTSINVEFISLMKMIKNQLDKLSLIFKKPKR